MPEEERIHAELLAVYDHVHADIENIKRRQWTQFTAIIVSEWTLGLIFKTNQLNRGVGLVIIMALTIWGFLLVWKQQDHLERNRKLASLYQSRFQGEIQQLLESKSAEQYLPNFDRRLLRWALSIFCVIVVPLFFARGNAQEFPVHLDVANPLA